jgi:hypothetical protein
MVVEKLVIRLLSLLINVVLRSFTSLFLIYYEKPGNFMRDCVISL